MTTGMIVTIEPPVDATSTSRYKSFPFEEQPWAQHGTCRKLADPDIMYPEDGDESREAKELCMRCPVRQDCLDYALRNKEEWGIWGGASEHDRERMLKGEDIILFATCGNPNCDMDMPALGGWRKFCTTECRKEADYQRTLDRQRERRAKIAGVKSKCPDCGASIAVSNLSRHRRDKHGIRRNVA